MAPEAHKEGKAVPTNSVWGVEEGIQTPHLSVPPLLRFHMGFSTVQESVTHPDHAIPAHGNDQLCDDT